MKQNIDQYHLKQPVLTRLFVAKMAAMKKGLLIHVKDSLTSFSEARFSMCVLGSFDWQREN